MTVDRKTGDITEHTSPSSWTPTCTVAADSDPAVTPLYGNLGGMAGGVELDAVPKLLLGV